MIDVLVLDEADRMIADGHFKELKFILNHIYTKRVAYKREALAKAKANKGNKEQLTDKVGMEIMKEQILRGQEDALKENRFTVSSNLERGGKGFDMSKVVDLDDADDIEDMMAGNQELVVDLGEKD